MCLRMAAVVAVCSFADACIQNGQCSLCAVLQRDGKGLLLGSGEAGQYPVRQVEIRVRLCTHADFYPGEVLTAQFLNDGFDAVVPSGGAAGTNPQPPRLQGDVVEKDDDPLGRNLKIGTELESDLPDRFI